LGGADAGNYSLTQPTLSGNITKKALTVTLENKSRTYGEANPALTFTYAGFLTGEDENILTTKPTATTTATTSSSVGTYTITASGGVSSNYTFNYVNGTLTITAKSITGTFSTTDKTYDGTASATVSNRGLVGVLTDDVNDVTLSGGTATFSNAEIGDNKTVTLTGAVLTGTKAGNYTLTSVATTTANIRSGATDAYSLNQPADITAGNRAAYTVTRKDAYNNLAVAGNETVYLSANNTGGKFFDAATGGNEITSVQISAGQSTANFWFRDTIANTYIITASDKNPADGNTGVKDAKDTIAVNAATAIGMKLSGPATGTSNVAVENITATVVDEYGNNASLANPTTRFQLTTTAANATFDSALVRLIQGTTSYIFKYTSPLAGLNTINMKWLVGTSDSVNAAKTIGKHDVTINAGPAAKLFIRTQPVGDSSGKLLKTQPVIEIQDAQGNLTSSNATIAVVIKSGANGSIGGTTSITASNGIATYSNLTLSGISTEDYILEFSAAGLTSAQSNSNVINSAAIKLNPGKSSKVIFTNAAKTLTAAKMSDNYSIQLVDANGNNTNTNQTIEIDLSTTATASGIFYDANKDSVITHAIIKNGTGSATFRYKDNKAGTPNLSLANLGLTGDAQQQTVNPGAAKKLVITSTAQTINAGDTTNMMTVEMQDSTGNAVKAPTGGYTVNLTSTGNFKFLNAAKDANITSITIPANSASANFAYTDTKSGTKQITATISLTGIQTATQNLLVNPRGAYATEIRNLTPTNPILGLNHGIVKIYLIDTFGNTTTASLTTFVELKLKINGTDASSKFERFDGNGNLPLVQSFAIGDSMKTVNFLRFTQATTTHTSTTKGYANLYTTLISGMNLKNGESPNFEVIEGHIYQPKISGKWTEVQWEKSNDGGLTFYDTPMKTVFETDEIVQIPTGILTAMNSDATVYSLVIDGILDITKGNKLTLKHTDNDLSDYNVHVHGTLLNSGGSFVNEQPQYKIDFHGGTYQHERNGGEVPAANWTTIFPNTAKQKVGKLMVTGLRDSVLTSGLDQNFQDIEWNNISQTAKQSIHGNVTVQGKLTMTAGIIQSNGKQLKVLGSTEGGTNTSYVEGKLTYANTTLGNKKFPIGNANGYMPLVMDYTELSDSSIITAEAINSDLPTTLSSELVKVGNRYWKIDEGKSSVTKKFNLSIGRNGLTLADTPFVIQVVNNEVKTHKSILITDYIVINDLTEGGEFAIATANPVAPKITGAAEGCIAATAVLSTSTAPASSGAWKSLDPTIATVDNKGVVTGVKAGTVKIVFTDYRKLTDTFTYIVKPSPAITAPINGECIIAPGVQRVYYVNKVANATSFKWTLPNGWTSNESTTDTIKIIANDQSGILSVVPFNGTCEGTGVSLSIGVIDLTKVTLTAGTATVLGDSIMSSNITMKMPTVRDVNGNKIACDNYNITFLTNNGGFSNITKVNDTTFTTVIRAFAGESLVKVRIGGGVAPATAVVNFTGPQGSMNIVSNPIIKGESPKLRFNFSEGIAPFTIVYRTSDTAKVYDTIANVLDGGEYTAKPLQANTRFKMMAIFAANGARRTANFTKDTVNITVLEPAVQVILEATKPQPRPDSTFGTKLGITVENTGQVDLNTIQINADLSSVFPPPTQYIVDSITFNGETVKLNSSFDGTTNTNLFAWNELPSKKLITRKYTVYETATISAVAGWNNEGETALNGQADMTNKADNYVMIPVEKEMQEEVDIDVKRNMFYFNTQSKLPIGKKSEVNIFMRLKPNGNKKPYVMQVAATGTAKLDTTAPDAPVAVASAVSTDAAAAAAATAAKKAAEAAAAAAAAAAADTTKKDTTVTNVIPEPVQQPFVEVPTVITIFPEPIIGAALDISEPLKLADDTYDVKLSYKLKNYGNIPLNNVAVFQKLSREIPVPATYKLKSMTVTSGLLEINSKFDGNLDSNMLTNNSILPFADSATFEMVINLKLTEGESLFRLQAIARAASIDGDLFTLDLTTNGNDPDPSADQIPGESVISKININVPQKILITGEIAIVDPLTSKEVNEVVYCDLSEEINVRPISITTGGLEAYKYEWETSFDGLAYSHLDIADDSAVSVKGFSQNTYLRRKVISGDQWAYSKPVFIKINKATKPVITASAKALEANGTVSLTSTDAASYKWSTNQTEKSITVSTAGRYALSIVDANGCKAVSDTMIIAPPAPAADKTTYILGAIDNPATVANSVKATASKSSFKFYSKETGGSLLSTPALPTAIGKFQYFVVQDVDGIESAVLPLEVTMLDPVSVVTVEKVISKLPELQADASFLIGFDFNLANLRGETITNIDLKDDLSKVFPSRAKVEIVSVKTTGKLNPNTFYNGYVQTGLLATGSEMAGNAKDTVRLMLRVYPNGFVGELTNIAEQTMKSPIGTFSMKSYDAKSSGSKPSVAGTATKFKMPLVIIIIPNGFTPNGDGINDKFVVVRPYNTQIELRVFDRNGVVVYQNLNYSNDWNGVSNQKGAYFGKDLPNGTYFYSINANDKTSSINQVFRGSITIRK
jgi:gliding motility-associated-like protein